MMFLCIYCNTVLFFHFSTPTHEEGIDLRASRSVRRTRSLQCQRSLIVAGDGATPSRHLLNYPRLRCLRCLLLLVGPGVSSFLCSILIIIQLWVRVAVQTFDADNMSP